MTVLFRNSVTRSMLPCKKGFIKWIVSSLPDFPTQKKKKKRQKKPKAFCCLMNLTLKQLRTCVPHC